MSICRFQFKARGKQYVLASEHDEEVARLKAEVELLTAEVSLDKRVQLHIDKLVAEFTQCQVERLQAEVERLRKAGDALYESEIGYYGEQILVDPKHHSGELCRNWIAAKEGKQP